MAEYITYVPDDLSDQEIFDLVKIEKFNVQWTGELIRCKDCKNWIPGYITSQDDFIPPKCGKYQQMVGHSADDFCSLAEKQEGR